MNSAALWSLIGIVVSIVLTAGILVYLRMCYFPGGFKRGEVMDIGEYAMFVAQAKHEERKKKLEEHGKDGGEGGDDEYDPQYDELYYEMTPRTEDDGRSRRDGSDWQSERTSEADIEGGEHYASSPSTHSMSDAAPTFDNRSSTPSSVAPSARSGLRPALKSGRDDRSESTFTSYY